MTAEKVESYLGFLLNISKMFQLIFTKPMSFSRQLHMVSFEAKRLKTGHFCCHGSQFMRECSAKSHDQKEEK